MKTTENGVKLYQLTKDGTPSKNAIFFEFNDGETTAEDVIERLKKDDPYKTFYTEEQIERINVIEMIFKNTLAYKMGYLDYEVDYQIMCLYFWPKSDKSILSNAEILARFIGFNTYVKFNKDLDRIEVVIF
ncbi:MAG TPA: hypothetical protein PLN36_05300 [Bacteroidales bacterium]|nr:hypothetical protein [Bacteroidales bacterium]